MEERYLKLCGFTDETRTHISQEEFNQLLSQEGVPTDYLDGNCGEPIVGIRGNTQTAWFDSNGNRVYKRNGVWCT
jgi:hypothetical protein